MGPEAVGSSEEHWSFPWWLFGILVSSPVSMGIGAVIGAVLIWQRKRIQLWAWRVRGRLR